MSNTDDLPALPEPFTAHTIADDIALMMRRASRPLQDVQKVMLHGALAVWVQKVQTAAVAQRDEQIAKLTAELAQARRDAAACRESLMAEAVDADKLRAEVEALRAALEIDYVALIAACYEQTRQPQGTRGCVQFKLGAEWLRERVQAALSTSGATPQQPGADRG